MNRVEHIESYFNRLKVVLDEVDVRQVEQVIKIFEAAYDNDRTVFICGNGGSSSAASHWVCDFSKGTNAPGKRRLRMFSLGDNAAMLTAYANDVDYKQVFSEPVKTYVRKNDVVIMITASGNSPNILEAAVAAREQGAVTVGLVGFGGGKLIDLVDHTVVVQSREYGPVEDLHMILDHIISTCVRDYIASYPA